ncbi:unnamed protein product [Fusarium venenatum]|uniref:KAP NTPase domain-containing protein n=1 Tax=Fusarium venenatum TaxID=56646 RepID=A0A2L2TUH2_9HYPO|nr:uncharacterized protein FVRRES_04328 [Fusarium venenatum]CEI67816.1 unnamed protein product [Fusarium venenatum]
MRLEEQFKVLLKTPLSQVGHSPSTEVIIIDALDECVDFFQVGTVIGLLASLKRLDGIRLYFLISSPNEDRIRAAIERQENDTISLATKYHDDNVSDNKSILTINFQRIRKEKRIESTWPTEKQFPVVHRSINPSPLFIYATTLLRFLGDGTRLGIPKKRLKS